MSRVRQWVRERRNNTTVNINDVTAAGWPHVYIKNYDKLTGVGDWLRGNVGLEDYVWAAENFWFTHERDAVMFKLSWISKAEE